MSSNKLEVKQFTPEVKQRILDELNKRDLLLPEPVSLVDGFINQPINMNVSNDLVIGGPTIPMITLVGNKTGRLYFIALKMLLNDGSRN